MSLSRPIVWDAVAANFADKTEAVAIPPEQNAVSPVAVGLLRASRQPDLARQFVRFLTSLEAQAVFAKHHYTISLRDDPARGSSANDTPGGGQP